MDDHFTKGFVSGIIAALPGTVIAIIAHAFKWFSIRWSDFAAVLVFGHQYQNLKENCFATFVTLVFIGTMGGLFPLVLQLISAKNLLFKAWLYSVLIWYCSFSVKTIFRISQLEPMDLKNAFINLLFATAWGILLGVVYRWFDQKYTI